MRKPLYLIRTDAVLIHPSLPGFPIVNPPRMAAAPHSTHSDFIVGLTIPPISWPGTLSWYGCKQAHRAHIWPLRALLHLYLLVSTHQGVLEQPGSSLEFIYAHPDTNYQTLLDSGAHYVGNFWSRIPEMTLLALSIAKEPMVPAIIKALMSAAIANDRAYGSGATLDFSQQLTYLVERIQATLNTPGAEALPLMGLTRRRAGVLERALISALRAASPNPTITYSIPTPTLPKTSTNRMLTEHRTASKQTLGENPSWLHA